MEDGKLVLKSEPEDIRQLFKDIIRQFELLCKAEEKEFRTGFEDNLRPSILTAI